MNNNLQPVCLKKSSFFELWSWPKNKTYGVLDSQSEVIVFYTQHKILAKVYFIVSEVITKLRFLLVV